MPLKFLTKGRSYIATTYADGSNAHWCDNPQVFRIEKENVDSNSVIRLNLAPGGGAAVSIKLAVPAQKK